MSSSWEADALVALRSTHVDQYKRNFLRQVVCELRFPTMMELGDPKPPSSLVAALRKEYPHLDMANEVTIGIGVGPSGTNHSHIFRSAKLTWTVSIKQSSLSVETTAYTDYAALKERVLRVVHAAASVIDTDFFTRVGMRYINVIDCGEDPSDGWVNPALVMPLRAGVFNNVAEYAGKLQLFAEDGGCLLQHGVQLKTTKRGSGPVAPEYFVDIDGYRNEVTVSETESALDAIHAQAFDVFDWALGEKSREFLSSSTTQPRS